MVLGSDDLGFGSNLDFFGKFHQNAQVWVLESKSASPVISKKMQISVRAAHRRYSPDTTTLPEFFTLLLLLFI